MARSSAWRVGAACCVWALIHSVFASRWTKDRITRLIGPHRRDGLNRAAYNALALATAGWFLRWFARQPDRELYRVPAPWSWVLYAGQLAAAGLLATTLRAAGFRRVSGLAPLAQFLAGRKPTPEPEAQGPAPGPDGELRVVGLFRHSRHPDNLSALGFWLCPRMTVNRATLAALATAYALLGSLHEEYRLQRAYGAAYTRYRRRVPFFLPCPGGTDTSAG